jgi:predicted transcriptional regulator
MEMLPASRERKAQLDDYVRRHGKDTAAALDEVLGEYLEWEKQDYLESVEGIRRGCEDAKTGRTRPAAEFLEEVRAKYGFPPSCLMDETLANDPEWERGSTC